MMTDDQRGTARHPDELGRMFLERASAGDVDGVVELYESTAVFALPGGELATGTEAIRAAYRQLLATGRTFTMDAQAPALVRGDVALTSARIPSGATAEVARRQPDDTWLWVMDRPKVLA